MLSVRVLRVMSVWPVPFTASMTNTSSSPSSRVLTNAMLLLFGDQSQRKLSPVWLVRFVSPVPSVFTM